MGRHARGARLQRVPIATIVLGSLVVVVIGVGTWVGLKNQPAPTVAMVDASAVVVSSPPCDPTGGRTVVDVLDMGASETGGTTRAELNGCGYREGQVLAVQHAVGDPTQVAIAEVVDTTDLQPLGMLAALLLAIAVTVAAWYDGRAGRLFRRGRRIDLPGGFAESAVPGSPQAGLSAGWIGSPMPEPDFEAGLDSILDTVNPVASTPIWMTDPEALKSATRTGRHARIDPTDTEILESGPLAPVEPAAPEPAVATPLESPANSRDGLPEVDLAYGFGADFAASLRDELFTHRGAPSLP